MCCHRQARVPDMQCFNLHVRARARRARVSTTFVGPGARARAGISLAFFFGLVRDNLLCILRGLQTGLC